MPLRSKSQWRYMHKFHPKLAKKWRHKKGQKPFRELPVHVENWEQAATFLEGAVAYLREQEEDPLLVDIADLLDSWEDRNPDTTAGSYYEDLKKLYNAYVETDDEYEEA